MITRDDIRELANFQSAEGCAITFYYQPSTPLNKSHREEATQAARDSRGELTVALKSFETQFSQNVKEFNELQRQSFF